MITIRVKKLTGLSAIRGLINKKHISPVYIETRFGIHTFGIKKPIDVVVLDNTFHVVRLCKGMRPNRIYMWNPLYRYALELPEGSIEHLHIKKGVGIRLIFKKL